MCTKTDSRSQQQDFAVWKLLKKARKGQWYLEHVRLPLNMRGSDVIANFVERLDIGRDVPTSLLFTMHVYVVSLSSVNRAACGLAFKRL